MASGINDTFRQVGVAVGVAAWGAIFLGAGDRQGLGGWRRALRWQGTAGHGRWSRRPQAASWAPRSARCPWGSSISRTTATRQGFLDGLNEILLIGGGVALAGALLSLVLVREGEIERGRPRGAGRFRGPPGDAGLSGREGRNGKGRPPRRLAAAGGRPGETLRRASAGGARGPSHRRSSSPDHLFEACHQGRHGSASPARASSAGSGAARARAPRPRPRRAARSSRGWSARSGPASAGQGVSTTAQHVQPGGTGRPQGQQRVADRAEAGSRGDQQGHAQVGREVAHQVAVVQGHRSDRRRPRRRASPGARPRRDAHAVAQGSPASIGSRPARPPGGARRPGRSAAARPPRARPR